MVLPFSMKLLISGKLDKKHHGIYLLFLLIFFLGLLGISQLLFPGGYDWTHRFISEEGNPDKNPLGWVFFTISICGTSLLFIPNSLYIYRLLKPRMLIFSRINLGFLLLGSIGLFIVGSVNENIRYIHDFGAILAFGSYGAGAFCSFIICLRKNILRESWPPMAGFLFLFGIIINLGIYIAYNYAHITSFNFAEGAKYQWSSFWLILTYFCGMYLLSWLKK